MKKYIYVGELDYNDEFNGISIGILSEEDHKFLQSKLDHHFDCLELNVCSGEEMFAEDMTVGEIIEDFKINELDEDQVNFLMKLGLSGTNSLNYIEQIIKELRSV